jgi:hypothetical protein
VRHRLDFSEGAAAEREGSSPIETQLTGQIVFAEGKPGPPPPPLPCSPVAVKTFAPQPVSVSGVGCLCTLGAANPIAYGPGNVGIGMIGCSDAPELMRVELTLQSWVIDSGCEPGHPDDGPDGVPCTQDDPGRQNAPASEVQFACSGDCNRDGTVTVDELLRAVSVALGNQDVYACPSADEDADGTVSIEEILTAVHNALTGCRGLAINDATPVSQ